MNLMFGYLGNGITVCDRERMEYGDYKKVAHIDDCGAVRLYDTKLPADGLARINAYAAEKAQDFKNRFMALPYTAVVNKLYNTLTAAQFVETNFSGKTNEQLYWLYITYVCLNQRRQMPES